jgi:hypothetical protein
MMTLLIYNPASASMVSWWGEKDSIYSSYSEYFNTHVATIWAFFYWHNFNLKSTQGNFNFETQQHHLII